jgi:hypothetical protein
MAVLQMGECPTEILPQLRAVHYRASGLAITCPAAPGSFLLNGWPRCALLTLHPPFSALFTQCRGPFADQIPFDNYLSSTSGYRGPLFHIPECSTQTSDVRQSQARDQSFSSLHDYSVPQSSHHGNVSWNQSFPFLVGDPAVGSSIELNHVPLLPSSIPDLTGDLLANPYAQPSDNPTWFQTDVFDPFSIDQGPSMSLPVNNQPLMSNYVPTISYSTNISQPMSKGRVIYCMI